MTTTRRRLLLPMGLVLLLASTAAADRLDPNVATAEELNALPGLGPAKAKAIVADREANGPFGSVDDLDRVKGVGPTLLAKLKEHLEVRAQAPARGGAEPQRLPATRKGDSKGEAKAPREEKKAAAPREPLKLPATLEREPPDGKVNLNFAGADELQALDGVSSANALLILAYRQQHGPFRTVADLGRVPGLTPKLLQTLPYFVTVKLNAKSAGENAMVASGIGRELAKQVVGLREKQKGKLGRGDLKKLGQAAPDELKRLNELLWFP
jgi:competence protein ComEA